MEKENFQQNIIPNWLKDFLLEDKLQLRQEVIVHIKNNNELQLLLTELLGVKFRTLEEYLRKNSAILLRIDILNKIYFDLITARVLTPEKYEWFMPDKFVYALLEKK